MTLVRSFSVAVICVACLRKAPPAAPHADPAVTPDVTAPPVAPQPAPPPALPAPPAPDVTPDVETPVRFVVRVTGGASEDERLPLIVAIHGLGDTPESFVEFVAQMNLRARIAAPAGLQRYGDGYSWFPSRVGTERSIWVGGIQRAANALAPAIRQLVAERPTCGLPMVTGFSQGGMLSYALVAVPAVPVGAAFPIGGLLPRELWPPQGGIGGLQPGVWAFHGAADTRVPFDDDRAANEAFRAAGYSAELRAYPGVGHTITPAMARDVEARIVETARDLGCPVRATSP